jgi:hypothetical protein
MKRKIVKNRQEYLEFIKAQNNKTNVYATVYDFEQFSEMSKIDSSVILDRIFLDFDGHDDNLLEAFVDLNCAYRFVEEQMYEHTMFFSGKGFHMFLFGEITSDIRNIQAFHRNIKTRIANDPTATGETLDDRVGQSTRLRRVPNTVNMSSSNSEGNPYYCIPIFGDDLAKGLPYILELAQSPRLISRKTSGRKAQWPKLPPLGAVEGEVSANIIEGRLPILPCLESAIMVENPSHMARAYLVAWYRDLLSGCRPLSSIQDKNTVLDKIVEEIKLIAENNEEVWLDWDERETRKHARFTVHGNYKAPYCKTKLIPEGYCIGRCWRYPDYIEEAN